MNSHKKGFSLVEVILAAFIFTVFASGAIIAVISGHQANRLGEEETLANQYASEGIEAVRSIKNQNFTNLVNSAGTGLARVSGVWTFSGSNNQFGPNNKYTRVISVADVQRDANGNIVTSGGTVDSLTKKIDSTVSWSASAARANSIVLTTYLTNWRKAIVGNWVTPSVASTVDLAGNGNGIKIDYSGNYAYIVRSVGSPNLIIIDVSNPLAPSLVGSMNVSGTPTDIFVLGNYAYVSSTTKTAQLQIVNISTPSSPVATGIFTTGKNNDGNGIYVVGQTAYLVTSKLGNNPNFYSVDVSNPLHPVQLGSLSIANGNVNDLVVIGSYGYAVSSANNSELDVVNVSNPVSLSQVSSLNLPGNSNALAVTGFGSTVLVGRVGGDITAINVNTPTNPAIISTLNVGGDVNDMSLGNNNTYLFLATANATAEFRVLDISNLSAISVVGSLDMSSTQNGLVYSSTADRVYIVGSTNNAEFAILQPN